MTTKALGCLKQKMFSLAEIGVFLGCGCFVLSLLARFHWFFELFCHFKTQYAVALVISGSILIFGKRWRWSTVAFVLALANIWSIWPYYIKTNENCSTTTPPFTVVTFNVLTSNTNYSELLSALRDIDTDVVFLMEVNRRWVEGLQGLTAEYPHHITKSREDNFGIALYSKQPFVESHISYFGDPPSVYVQIDHNGVLLNIIGTHPVPPSGANGSHRRNLHLNTLVEFIQKLEGEVIVVGDLNTTPFAPSFQDFLTRANLRDSAIGFGMSPTWNRSLPIFAIPIDHILISQNLCVNDRNVLGNYGSDHSLIFASLYKSAEIQTAHGDQ